MAQQNEITSSWEFGARIFADWEIDQILRTIKALKNENEQLNRNISALVRQIEAKDRQIEAKDRQISRYLGLLEQIRP